MPKKKQTRRTRPASTGVDPNERRRERLEARRQAKQAALAAQAKRERRERLVRFVLLSGLFALAAWFFFIRGSGPAEIAGHEIETFSTQGVGDHQNADITYETRPPVSGPHAPLPSQCGVFGSPIGDETQVHTLEHGAVGIQYQPDLDAEQIAEIEDIVGEYDSHVFSAPYADMPTPIAVTSWGRVMRLDEVDATAIREYIDEFAGNGPEDQDCPNTMDQPFQAEGASPSPSPSGPSPEPTDGEDGGGRRDGKNRDRKDN